jgi:hypothetical protein
LRVLERYKKSLREIEDLRWRGRDTVSSFQAPVPEVREAAEEVPL